MKHNIQDDGYSVAQVVEKFNSLDDTKKEEFKNKLKENEELKKTITEFRSFLNELNNRVNILEYKTSINQAY